MSKLSGFTQGIHHAGLTVTDVTTARDFFIEVLGFEQVGEKPEYPAIFVSDGTVMITLWQVEDPQHALAFDHRTVVGLHHLALGTNAAGLEELHERLRRTAGVSIEFPPEPLGTGPARHMMFTMPGGIRLELIAP
jgi:catechol 2,3-dioxygenase-like lactoylglutathione lyase family enzyme